MIQSPSHRIAAALALLGFLLALPAMYFFIGSFLKYELNLLPATQIYVPPPAVMIGGLVVAIALNLGALFYIKPTHGRRRAIARKLKSRALSAIVAAVALLFLALLLGYVLVENLAEGKIA